MNTKIKLNFNDFISKFPEIELPITLGENTHFAFSQENPPLPAAMIETYIAPLEEVEPDEFTEFIPCFRIPKTFDIHAVVYWKASLMDYQYHLVTFDKNGVLIDKRVIAGTFSDGKDITQSIATIDEDWEIVVATGQTTADNSDFDSRKSKVNHLELLPEGHIINHSIPKTKNE